MLIPLIGFICIDESLAGGIKGSAYGTIAFSKSSFDLSTIINQIDFKEKIKKHGYQETDSEFKKDIALVGAKIKIGRYSTLISSYGDFYLSGIPAGHYKIRLINEGTLLYKDDIYIEDDEVKQIDINIGRRSLNMYQDQHKASSVIVDTSPKYICRDYNGLHGNCVKYNPQDLVNFFASDCDFALGSKSSMIPLTYCWKDVFDPAHRYCDSTTRNCSSLINHKTEHHCHS